MMMIDLLGLRGGLIERDTKEKRETKDHTILLKDWNSHMGHILRDSPLKEIEEGNTPQRENIIDQIEIICHAKICIKQSINRLMVGIHDLKEILRIQGTLVRRMILPETIEEAPKEVEHPEVIFMEMAQIEDTIHHSMMIHEGEKKVLVKVEEEEVLIRVNQETMAIAKDPWRS